LLGHTEGLEEGRKTGLEEGLEKSKAEVALAMLQGGLSIKQISSVTGLTADEITGLSKLQ